MDQSERIDRLLADSLRLGAQHWPDALDRSESTAVLERARYHGIASLLLPLAAEWPGEVRAALRDEAISCAAWELRHRALLEPMLAQLDRRGVESVLLKGTALAYLVYDQPASRSRADTDLLVRPEDRKAARGALAEAGFEPLVDSRNFATSAALQEGWQALAGGNQHSIDLHWAAFNSAFLADILPVEDCLANTVAIPALAPGARALALPNFLLHVCIHRNLHRTAPYFSGGKALLGAGRLVWAVDIERLANAFGEEDWAAFVALAREKRVVRAMAEALAFAERTVGARIPDAVRSALKHADPNERRSAFLLDLGRRSRVLANLGTGGGRRAQLRALLAPSDLSLRARYPGWRRAPRLLLLARRLFDFVAARQP